MKKEKKRVSFMAGSSSMSLSFTSASRVRKLRPSAAQRLNEKNY